MGPSAALGSFAESPCLLRAPLMIQKAIVTRHSVWHSYQQDWVYTLETDTETFSSLVSSTRLRLKILESGDRDFDETFVLAFRDRDLTFHIFETET